MQPIRTFNSEEMRTRMMADLRRRLGREPTDADIEAEKARERREHPMRTLSVDNVLPATRVML